MKRTKATQKPKRRASAASRLKSVNKALEDGLVLQHDGLWIWYSGRMISLAVPEDIRQQIRATLASEGDTPASLARRLNKYGVAEFTRRFGNVFPEDEPDADRLTHDTDETWKVI